MMTSLLTATLLACAQPQPQVMSAVEQLAEVVAAQIATTEEQIKKLEAICEQMSNCVNHPKPVYRHDNPFSAISDWHTAMAKLHGAHKRTTHWKRTRAQITSKPSPIMFPEHIMILLLIMFH